MNELINTKIKMLDIVNGMDIEAERICCLLDDIDQDLFCENWDDCNCGLVLEISHAKCKNDLATICARQIRKNCKSAIEQINKSFDKLDAELVKTNVIELDQDDDDDQAANVEVNVIKF